MKIFLALQGVKTAFHSRCRSVVLVEEAPKAIAAVDMDHQVFLLSRIKRDAPTRPRHKRPRPFRKET
jgi:hypothetical protein